MKRPILIRVLSAAAAAGLVALSSTLPLWTLTMRAPQYPKGLRLTAYGTSMVGDIRELNILNHYIGMPPIEAPALETSMFPIGIAALIVLCLLAPFHRWLRRLAVFAVTATPFMIVLDLQWRLYMFGHTLNPQAPIRLKPFTPLVIGTSHMGNFVSSGMVASGVLCLFAAAVALIVGTRLAGHFAAPARHASAPRTAVAAAIATLLVAGQSGLSAQPQNLQDRIASAPPGSTLIVDGGTHAGPIRIHGPLTVIGRNNPVIDGRGRGSVVAIEGDEVVFRGFRVRNSGREVTEEAAGIKATGNRHTIEDNDVRDVYFGIHIDGGDGYRVANNRISPGVQHGARPGHGISVWNARNSRITGNHISDARDGVYLSFAEGAVVSGNDVTRCRYGLHSMSSLNATLIDNTLVANLLGAALMQSDKLVLRANRIEQHRQGSAAYGVLLKDIGDLVAEDNVILSNRVGVYAEGVPLQPTHQAVMMHNTIAGNDVGLALQSNAALTIAENRIADNLADVRPLGRRLSPSLKWSRNGRGNSWSQYRGYDADADGLGDLPYTVNEPMDALIRKNSLVQAFLYTPAHLALEAAARMFPLYRDQPLLVDEHPLMSADIRGSR
ncbi:MAG: nitrous oxide reductase family maturation protein NosD [Vicinamibacterales bacterium]